VKGPWHAVTRGTGGPCEGTGVWYSRENYGSCVAGYQAAYAAHFEMGAGCHVDLEACYVDLGACYVDLGACYADQEAYYAGPEAYYVDQEAFYADPVACCVDQEACHVDWDDQVTYHADQDGQETWHVDQGGLVVIQDDQVAFHVVQGDQDDQVAYYAFVVLEAYHVDQEACCVVRMAFPAPLVSVLDLSLAFPPLAF